MVEDRKVQGVQGEKTILHHLISAFGAGGTIDLKPNTEKEMVFGGTTLTYLRLWGRVDVREEGARWELDDPKPVATGKKLFIPFKATINSLDVTNDKVVANTSLGTYEVWSKS